MLSLLLAGTSLVVCAQPFDTLLAQYNSIIELYPFEDSTYILIGRGDQYSVGYIDDKAAFMWHVDLPYGEKFSIYDYKIDVTPADTTIQILFGDFECDYYPGRQFEAVTISMDGTIRDSQSWPGSWGRPFLLSGSLDRPRVAIGEDEYCILIDRVNDTMHFSLAWSGLDTSLYDLIGFPHKFSMCPNGDLRVLTINRTIISLSKVNDRYQVFDSQYFRGGRDIICLEDSTYINIHDHRIERWVDRFPKEKFVHKDYINIYSTHWRDPYLQIYTEDFEGHDTIFLLDKYLTVHSKFPVPDIDGFQHFVITPEEAYLIGGGNTYFDDSYLGSENRLTNEGPRHFDIEFTNIEIGPYDAVQWIQGGLYHYEISNAQVTIRNNCDYPINEVIIAYTAENPWRCYDTIWERKIEHMNLQPGESGVFQIHDIYIRHAYPYWPYEDCFYLMRPDNHLDDNFDDNTYCEKLELLPATPDPFPIHHRQTVLGAKLRFLSPDKIDFNLGVFTMNGYQVFAAEANTYADFTINIETWPRGMYVLQYTIPATGQVYVEKMIKPY